MCVVSMVMDYGKDITLPWRDTPPYVAPFYPALPNIWPMPSYPPLPTEPVDENQTPVDWTPETWQAFRDLLDAAAAFDELTGQGECEDPEKGMWIHEVEEKLDIQNTAPSITTVEQPRGVQVTLLSETTPPMVEYFMTARSWEKQRDGSLSIVAADGTEEATFAAGTWASVKFRQAPTLTATTGIVQPTSLFHESLAR